MQMIIASRLTDGRVVFMNADGAWVDSIASGAVFDKDTDGDRLMAMAQRAVEKSQIVEPYFIDVLIEGVKRCPAHVREAIRAFGPSVRTDLSSRVDLSSKAA